MNEYIWVQFEIVKLCVFSFLISKYIFSLVFGLYVRKSMVS